MITFIRQNLLLVLLLAAARSGACQRDPKDPGPVDPPPVAGTEIPPGKRMEVIKSTEGKFASLNWNDAAAAQNEPVDFLKTPAADRSSLHCTRQRQRMDPVYRRRTAPAGQQPDRLPETNPEGGRRDAGTKNGANATVTGNVTMTGNTHPVTFPAGTGI